MKPNLRMAIILPSFIVCTQTSNEKINFIQLHEKDKANENPYATIADIPAPEGFSRIDTEKKSFAAWLRALPLKKNKTVYLYNGLPKRNQSAQFAVVNISVGIKDLQQCADAVMRLRAEYLYAQKRFAEIIFHDNNNTGYKLGTTTDRKHFDEYLDNVFARCGTLSLEKQLKPVEDAYNIQPGDVLIQGGSPGHAMIVVDMAINTSGKKIYLLAQSYMPAQDIHIVINPADKSLSPWYEMNNKTIVTPEWVFTKGHFRTWPVR
jgi:uncharacterized protein DUF4846